MIQVTTDCWDKSQITKPNTYTEIHYAYYCLGFGNRIMTTEIHYNYDSSQYNICVSFSF